MIVNEGKLKLLDSQSAYIRGLVWALFTNNVAITSATVFADLTEAAWAGYTRQTIATVPLSAIVAGKASTSPTPPPVFTNTTAAGVTFYGWMLIDTANIKLIAAVNIGLTTIPAGGSYAPTPTITDDQGP